MTSNTFFTRDGYSTYEKRKRISAEIISPDTPEVREILGEIGEAPQEGGNLTKDAFFTRLQEELESEEYDEFVDTLFSEYGKKGDRFNIQLFEFAGEISYNKLVENVEEYEGYRLDNIFSDISDPVALDLVEPNENEGIVDLNFKVTERLKEIEADEDVPIQVRERGGEESEVREFGEGYEVIAPAGYRVEVRIYTKEGLAAVSNYNEIRDGLQTEIIDVINEIGHSEEDEA